MQIRLDKKIAIVTGSTFGIGFGAAKGLAECGAHVILNGRNAAHVEQAVERIRTALPDCKVEGYTGDLGNAEGCEELVAQHQHCDILVNNLGIYGQQDFFETDDSEWQRYFDVNIMSGVRLARSYAPGMQNKGWGRIVFISSESGLNIPQDMIHYGFTKSANISIARGLAKRLAGTGVTVNSVLPGPTLSEGLIEMVKPIADQKGLSIEQAAREFVEEHRPSSIIQRAATVEEVTNMIVYACSEQSSATSGAALRVEGGVVDSIG